MWYGILFLMGFFLGGYAFNSRLRHEVNTRLKALTRKHPESVAPRRPQTKSKAKAKPQDAPQEEHVTKVTTTTEFEGGGQVHRPKRKRKKK